MDFPEASSSLTASGELNVYVRMEIKAPKQQAISILFCSALLPQNLSIPDHHGRWVSLLQSIPLHHSHIRASLTFLGRGIGQRGVRCWATVARILENL